MGARGPLPGSGGNTRAILLQLQAGPKSEATLHAVLALERPVLRATLWRLTWESGVLEMAPDPVYPSGPMTAYRIKEGAAIDERFHNPRRAICQPQCAGDHATRSLQDAFANIVAGRATST
jgi:hypothetical protein